MNSQTKKILLYAGQDITAHLVLNRIIPFMVRQGFKPVIFITGYKAPQQGHLEPLQNISFYERKLTQQHIYPYLEYINGSAQAFYSPKQLAHLYNLEIIENLENINEATFNKKLADDQSIIGAISISCLQIFKASTIRMIKEKGFLWNLHPGILPDVRGLYAPLWAMHHRHRTFGPTLHHIDEGIDTGRIIELRRQPVDYAKSYLVNRISLAPLGADIIINTLGKYKRNETILGWSQENMNGEYYSFPTQDMLHTFTRQNISLVGAPTDMARMYLSFFKPSDAVATRELQNMIVGAIAAHEAARQKAFETAA